MCKVIALRLGCALLALAVCFPVAAQDRDGIQRELAYRRFARSAMAQLDCDSLWHLRNSIFARHGYRFKTARGQQVFGTGGWTDNPQLSAVERHNVGEIQAAEKMNGCSPSNFAQPGSPSITTSPAAEDVVTPCGNHIIIYSRIRSVTFDPQRNMYFIHAREIQLNNCPNDGNYIVPVAPPLPARCVEGNRIAISRGTFNAEMVLEPGADWGCS